MITVTFFEGKNGKVTKVRMSGHSGYAESGSDIVCAAVSTLVQTAYLAIEDLGTNTSFIRDADKPLFEFTIGEDVPARHEADVILRALVVGLNDLRSGFPQYLKTETVKWRQ